MKVLMSRWTRLRGGFSWNSRILFAPKPTKQFDMSELQLREFTRRARTWSAPLCMKWTRPMSWVSAGGGVRSCRQGLYSERGDPLDRWTGSSCVKSQHLLLCSRPFNLHQSCGEAKIHFQTLCTHPGLCKTLAVVGVPWPAAEVHQPHHDDRLDTRPHSDVQSRRWWYLWKTSWKRSSTTDWSVVTSRIKSNLSLCNQMLGFCSPILVQRLQFSDGQRKQQRLQNVARNRRTVGSGVVITSYLNMSCLGHGQAQLGRGGTVETSLKISREIRKKNEWWIAAEVLLHQ